MSDQDYLEPYPVIDRPHGYMESLAEINHRTLNGGSPKARPSVYKGIPMRSRLEVRFAYHLDARGERWTYEPRIYGHYLPDFEILGTMRPTFIEVKPTLAELAGAQQKAAVIWKTHPTALIVVAVEEGCTFSAAVKGGQWETWQERWAA